MIILHRYNWILDTPQAKESKLRFRVKWCNSKRIATFSIGFKVETAKWSAEAQRCKANTTHGKMHLLSNDINRKIEQYEGYADSIFDEFGHKDVLPAVEDFRTAFNLHFGKLTADTKTNINSLFGQFIEETGTMNDWSKATYTKFRTVQNLLYEFNPSLSTASLDVDCLRSFMAFLVGKGYRNSYVAKLFDLIKWFCRWLTDNGYYSGNAHNQFKPRLKGAESVQALVYLTWDEVMKLNEFEPPTQSLKNVKDVFLFCCFTGLRYSDVAKLQKADIVNDCIYVVTKKTTDSLCIELNDYSRAILAKYADIDLGRGRALPVISNVKYNSYLKTLAKLAGFDSVVRKVYYNGSQRHEIAEPKYNLVTTHCARRTFVVNALYLGISTEVIMKWTGHSNYDAMKPYIAIVDDLKKSEMNKFNRR